jgi:glutamate racemase
MSEFSVVFCDSCLGGTTVAARLAATRGGLRAFYLADYAVNPLGLKSEADILATLARWREVARSRSDTLVVACNTASVLYEHVHDRLPRLPRHLRIRSMVDLVDALLGCADLEGRRVCLMGTRFTVAQPLYRERLLKAGARAVVPLAATVTEHVVARLAHRSREGRQAVAREIGDAIRGCDAVLLACTCFPMVTDIIHDLNPACLPLDPASGVEHVFPDRGSGPNRITVALSGTAVGAIEVREHASILFPGWEVEDVVAMAPQGAHECACRRVTKSIPSSGAGPRHRSAR